MTNKADLPTALRSLRAKLALTQEQLADRLGVSFATVNRWEGGQSKPQRAQAEAIAALLREAGIDEGAGGAGSDPEAAPIVPRRTRRAASATPTTKPMEQMLWDAACSIRGEKDAAKFKDYLLPLLFLKRLSDVFDDEITRLAEDYGDRATALEIAESTLTDRYQTTVPETVRRALRLGKRDKIHYTIRPGGEVVLTRVDAAEVDDPVLGQFLGFLARDIVRHPERLQAIDAAFVQRLQSLTGGIEVDLDASLSADDE